MAMSARPCIKNKIQARQWWLTPVILATQEAEIRRTVVQSHPGQTVPQDYFKKALPIKGLVEWLKV
jgi:hypothetical protein